MTPERWQEVDRIYQAAVDHDPAARSAFLDEACAGDAELRREVGSLLDAQNPGDRFPESPALAVTARALAGEAQRAARGQRLGSYELLEPLGTGGMGEVWRALDPALNRQVAIKILLPQYSRDPERLRRFEQEARAAGMLNHPNVLAIYAIGKEEGSPYLVTELLEGTTLRKRLAAGVIPEGKAVEYASQIAQGLAAAHDKRIVHRDLKPENLFLTSDGRVKILDFGLAKLVQPGPEQQDETQTASGIALGTPAYMSPEQVRGQPADNRSDIFALGAVLYEMLAGRRPFAGNSSAETMNAILNQEPPPLANASPAMAQIVRHCLEKEAGERFQSARDLSFQLRVQSSPAQTPVLPSTKMRRRYVAIAAAGLTLAGAFAGLTWWFNPTAKRSLGPTFTRVTSDSGLTTDPALSPDGKLVAYSSDRGGQGNLDIWRQQLATGEAIRLTSDSFDESEPAFSPDGSRIAFRSERDGGGIYVVSAFGGEQRFIASKGRRPRFSPDGAQIAYWVGGMPWYMGQAFVAPTAGGSPIAIQPDFTSVIDPIWSPDGKHLLFLGARNPQDISGNNFDWWIAPREGGPAIKTESSGILRLQGIQDGGPSLVAPAAWVGDQVFFSAKLADITSLWRLSVPPETGKATGLAQQLTSGTSFEAKPSITSGGQIVFASLNENLNIWSLLIDGNRGKVTGELQRLTDGAYDAHTSLSADGRKLVFTSKRSGNPDIWMKDLATGKESALTATPVNEEQPEITADGTRVCYMVPEGQSFAIYAVNTNRGIPERLCDCGGRPWDWSPDGRKILYLVQEGHGKLPGSHISLSFFDVTTRQKIDYLEHPQHTLARARFSPDGKWISLVEVTTVPGLNRVIVVPFLNRPVPRVDQWISITNILAQYDKPRWSPDGNLLYFTSDHDGNRCIRAQRLDPATKRPIGPAFDVYHSHSARRSLMNAGIRFQEISVSRDRLVFNLGEITGNIWMAKLEGKN